MKKKSYDRRTFLRAAGLGAGFLPLLEADWAPAQSVSGYPTRLITITWTNGIVPNQFYPPVGPLTAALPAILSPLEAYKSKILAFRQSNSQKGAFDINVMMDQDQQYGGHSAYPAILTGTWGEGGSRGPSIDTLIADHLQGLGVVSPLLNLGCRPYSSSTSWRSAGQKNTAQTDPYKVFSSLFSSLPPPPTDPGMPPVDDPGPSAADARRLRRGSVLDFVGTELEQFGTNLGTDDRAKVQAHLEAIRQLQAKLNAPPPSTGTGGSGGGGVPVGTGCAAPMLPDSKPNFNNVSNYPAHVSAMLAIAGAAVKCDVARCITIDLIDDGGGNSLTFPWLGLNSPDYHAIAHEGSASYSEKTEIDKWFFEQVAALVADLANTPEGTGSVLDNTCILIANDMNEGSNHYVGDMPYLIIGSCGGFFKTGETIGFPDNVPNNQLLTTICHAMGLEIPSVGDDYSGDIDSIVRA